MKILLYSDVHWSTYSSILRQRGEKYSIRLEGLIKSMNWALNLAVQYGCSMTCCLGDFFDTSSCNAEEISALKDIVWPDMPHYFVCGNHEMFASDHRYSSLKLFNLLPNSKVIASPETLPISNDCEISFLPYILEENRKSLVDYFGKKENNKKRVILSHNDIAGVQLGSFFSNQGFPIEEIEANCDKFINGHLHNGTPLTKKVINIGNLSGQNFSENAFKHDHVAFILDTDDLGIDVFENPYAFNFYKMDSTSENVNMNSLKPNAIVSLKCYDKDAINYKNQFENLNTIVDSRIVVDYSQPANTDNNEEIDTTLTLSVDHLVEFKNFILDTFGNNDIIISELNEICR